MTHDLRLTTEIDDLLRIREFVNPVLEMAEIAERMTKSSGGGKALLFENTGTDFPVLMNLYGSTLRMLRALGLSSYEEIEQKFNRLFADVLSPRQTLWDKLKLLPVLQQAAQWLPKVSKERGCCQEVVMPQPDLSKLPVLQCWPHDGGRFITLPMVHTKDPLTGARNVGMYRMQVFSPATAGMHWHRHKTGARHFAAFAAQHKEGRFPVAVALGGDPAYAYCAVAPMPENVDEYLLAGFLRDKPVSLVHCLTQPLEVPADVDFVIEGYVDANALPEVEGPFGDHTGFYSLEDLYPVMQVTCITHRKDAIYPATVVGIPPQEDACFSQATERIFLMPIRLALAPEIVDMHMPVEGVSHNLAIVKIKNDYPGQAIKVAHALWGAGQMMFNKMMIVVDGEVDITDYPALAQHVAQHYHPATDTYFSYGPLDVLDHAAATPAFGGKICIDATATASKENMTAEKKKPLYAFIHKGEKLPPAHVVVQFDKQVHLDDTATCVWLLGNNIDAVRDCRVADGQLIIDATTKGEQLFPRRWPNIVCASDETIASVDAQWERLGLGAFIPSPSLRYKHLLQKGGAAVALPEEELWRMPQTTAYYRSPAGWLKIAATDTHIRTVAFCDDAPAAPQPAIVHPVLEKCIRQLDEYFAGTRTAFALPLEPVGSDFQLRVWKEVQTIPYGETISYTELSQRIGDEKAIRAAGTANGKNHLAIIIPCHRVIGADGKLVGYAGGLHRKEWLLKFEMQHTSQGLFKV
ncbi:MAG: menaquinone biosynthesis decarboxylase [Prevotellaceae bacterium]|jgi:4-hydroxy-3-polyprenylbenzoate decarboxylase|nr:menaquinone biosynthesis decarboxylase [Prevotellaceae bacterium]